MLTHVYLAAGQLLWLVSYYGWSATTAGQLLRLVSYYGWPATTAGQLLTRLGWRQHSARLYTKPRYLARWHWQLWGFRV